MRRAGEAMAISSGAKNLILKKVEIKTLKTNQRKCERTF